MKYLIFLLAFLIGCQAVPPQDPSVQEYVPKIEQTEEKKETDVPQEIDWGDWELEVLLKTRKSTPALLYFYDNRSDSREMNHNLSDKKVVDFINSNFAPYKFHTSGFNAGILADLLSMEEVSAPFVIVIMPNIDSVKIMDFKGVLDKEDILAIPFLP